MANKLIKNSLSIQKSYIYTVKNWVLIHMFRYLPPFLTFLISLLPFSLLLTFKQTDY